MQKCRAGLIPNGQIMAHQFVTQNRGGYKMRNYLMQVPFYRTNARKICIKCSGPSIWNSLSIMQDVPFQMTAFSLKKLLVDYWLDYYKQNA